MGLGLAKFAPQHYSPIGEDGFRPLSWSDKASRLEELDFDVHSLVQPSNTVIIFDWDDTLLCSTAINRHIWTSDQLAELEALVGDILETSMRLGETHIITNGNGTWIQESSKYFFPNLSPILQRLHVMSARFKYEDTFPGDHYQWKRQAFKEVLAQRCKLVDPAQGVNLIVLGDSLAEMQAAEGATKVLSGVSLVKTVKFQELPSASDLIGQLRKARCVLHGLVSLGRSTSRGLVRRPIPLHADHFAKWATGWRVCNRKPAKA
jgi:hypothetical protein